MAATPLRNCSSGGERICYFELRRAWLRRNCLSSGERLRYDEREGRLAPPCQNDYQLLALLEESLPSGQSADHWRSLAERCSVQPLSEYVPEHELKALRSIRFP